MTFREYRDSLSDEELMEFIILPLTYKEEERKKFAVKESFDLTKKSKDAALANKDARIKELEALIAAQKCNNKIIM